MPADTSQYFDPEYLRSLGYYSPTPLQSYAGNLPTSGGTQTSYKTNMMGTTAPVFGGLNMIPGISKALSKIPMFGSLFGKEEQSFKPYVNEQGQYVWTNPNQKNPVPVANVPGAPLKPSSAYKKTAGNVQGLTDLMPYLNAAINQGIVPTAMENLRASQATSPGYAQLMADLYNQYGPQMNAIGNKILEQNMLANQESINKVLQGPGARTVEDALGLQKSVDRPFYDARELSGNRLADLLNSIDLSGGLSETERNEISKGLARENLASGTYGAPSQMDTVANAMRYGEAGYKRKQTAISNLSNALTQANQFMPASKSGIDAFQVATGKSSMVNPGAGLFPGINQNTGQSTNAQYGLAGSILGNMNQLNITDMNNAANAALNKKDWADYLGQVTSSIGNLTGAAGGAAGLLCWVAREVYGEDNPKWIQFRTWLLNSSPEWFRNLYIKYGERFSKFIHNKPIMKYFIRQWMNSVIE